MESISTYELGCTRSLASCQLLPSPHPPPTSTLTPPSPMEQFELTDANRDDPTFSFHATGQSLRSSHIDPPQDLDPAFDRWASLVEVCASTRHSALTAPSSPHPVARPSQGSNNYLHFAPSQPSMAQARPSDIEDELGPGLSSLECKVPVSTPRLRKRHACKMCDKAFDRPSTLKTVRILRA